MVDIAFFKVTREIANRTGLLKYRYRTVDGMFLIDNKDLQRVRMTSDEMLNGFGGIEKISLEEVERLKVENNYKMGDDDINEETISEPNENTTEEHHMAEDITTPIEIIEPVEETEVEPQEEEEVDYPETGDEPEDDDIIEEEENKEDE